MSEPVKLDIGCGMLPRPGYTPVDKYVTGPGFVNCDMWALPYGDSEVDEIFSSHALEHIPKAAVVPTLNEWRRVLRPGASATILVPDLEWCCRAWLDHKTNDWWMEIIFGNQNHPGEFHMTGYTPEIMIAYLQEAGFAKVEWGTTETHRQQTLVFVAETACS